MRRNLALLAVLLSGCAAEPPEGETAEIGQELGGLTVTLTSAPPEYSHDTTAHFSYGASIPGATFACQLDGAAYAPCSAAGVTYPVADGEHTFSVVATRGLLRSRPASWRWSVDTIGPAVTITDGPPVVSHLPQAVFAFTVDDPAAATWCQVDLSPLSPCTSPVAVAGLADGKHRFMVQAIDVVGNVGSAAAAWVVDTVTPSLTLTAVPSGDSIFFTFSASEPCQTTCGLDGGPLVACSSPVSLSGLSAGNHRFQLVGVDAAGNMGATSYLWTISP